MDAVNKLLDKAREACSIASDVALAEKLGVSRQLVSQWRKGANPMSDDRIAQIAHLAREDGGRWLLLVHAERAQGAAAKDWAALVRKFGAAAAVAGVALLSVGVIDVSAQDGVHSAASAMLLNIVGGMHYAKFNVELSAVFGRNCEASEAVSRSDPIHLSHTATDTVPVLF